MSKFQFPSNGKAQVKFITRRVQMRYEDHLFQFPSNGKAYVKIKFSEFSKRGGVIIRFNSLQTGRRM